MNVFDVVSRHMDWVGQRFSVASANVANLDTPGYRAREVEDFNLALKGAQSGLSASDARHISASATGSSSHEISDQRGRDETHSGNNVSLENEMRVIGESTRQMGANTALLKLYHRMLLSSVKG